MPLILAQFWKKKGQQRRESLREKQISSISCILGENYTSFRWITVKSGKWNVMMQKCVHLHKLEAELWEYFSTPGLGWCLNYWKFHTMLKFRTKRNHQLKATDLFYSLPRLIMLQIHFYCSISLLQVTLMKQKYKKSLPYICHCHW